MRSFILFLSLFLFLVGCGGSNGSKKPGDPNNKTTKNLPGETGPSHTFDNQSSVKIAIKKPGQDVFIATVKAGQCVKVPSINQTKVAIFKYKSSYEWLNTLIDDVDISKNNYITIKEVLSPKDFNIKGKVKSLVVKKFDITSENKEPDPRCIQVIKDLGS